jgi:hypothetical protein
MEIKNSYFLIGFILLTLTLGYTLYNIYQFMPVLASCEDDFGIIDKCKCLPQEYPNMFPGKTTKYSNFTING